MTATALALLAVAVCGFAPAIVVETWHCAPGVRVGAFGLFSSGLGVGLLRSAIIGLRGLPLVAPISLAYIALLIATRFRPLNLVDRSIAIDLHRNCKHPDVVRSSSATTRTQLTFCGLFLLMFLVLAILLPSYYF